MKNKVLIIFSVFVCVLILILFFVFIRKNNISNSDSKYTQLEIKSLISKGFENFNNISFDIYDYETGKVIGNSYYYNDNYKTIGEESERIRYDKEKKSYIINK